MFKKLIICSLFLTLPFGWHFIYGVKAQPETYCGFPTEEEHRLVRKWMQYHGILDCYQDHNGRYYFVRRGQKINLIGGGDYEN